MTEPVEIDRAARTIAVQRRFTTTAERAWAGWTDPAILARWWGPAGWTTTIEELDVRPGGHWRYTMRPADGSGPPRTVVAAFATVDAPRELTYLDFFGAAGDVANASRTRVTFTPDGADVVIRIEATLPDDEWLARALEFGMADGFVQALAKLAASDALAG